MAPRTINEEPRLNGELIEDTDLWKYMHPKMINIYKDDYNIDDYDGNRDDLNDEFIKWQGNDELVLINWIDNDRDNEHNIIDMIKKDCLIIQNWISSEYKEFDDVVSFDKINTERKIFMLFMYFLCNNIVHNVE